MASPTNSSTLLERDRELGEIDSAIARLREAGTGGVILVEAAAGLGKTALLDHTTHAATAAGCRVRRAAPGPLERHFPYGAVRALLEAPLREAAPADRARVLDGPAAAAGALLLGDVAADAPPTTAIAHSLLWLCTAMAAERPLVFVIDDAHWCDRSSLEVLCYLARRVADLPLLILVAARVGDAGAPTDLLSLIGSAPAATVLSPQPLTPAAAVRMLRRMTPDVPIATCLDHHRATHGNPWLLGELARQIDTLGADAVSAGDGAPAPVSTVGRDVIRGRLAALSPRERAVANAAAILGDGAPAHVLADLAQVNGDGLSSARDALVAAGLLAPSGTALAHGLIATAIRDDLSGCESHRLHRDAARLLSADGADPEVVGDHLLHCAPRADATATTLLVRAAGAVGHAAPQKGAAYLARALEERAPQVVEAKEDSIAGLLEHELAGETDEDTRLEIETAVLDALQLLPDRHAERRRRVAAIKLTPATDPLLSRVVLAHRSWAAAEQGTPDAEAAAALARRALEGGLLLSESSRRLGYHLALRTLVLTDRFADARTAVVELTAQAQAQGTSRLSAVAAWTTAELDLRSGQIADAESAARSALDVADEELTLVTSGAAAVLVCALTVRGAFDEAHEQLDALGLDGPLDDDTPCDAGVRHARAELALAECHFELAHAEACAAGAMREQEGRTNPAWSDWRSIAAVALARLGRHEEAIELADAELALAQRFGAPVPIVRALHARAFAEPDAVARIAICKRALALAPETPALLETTRVRLQLGCILTRLGRHLEAREHLRVAFADADAAGARPLADAARGKLVATGLRPRRAALEGAAALTPRQRQVCELAAAGKTNRAIAQQLFLSPKTVETHLAQGYRKLGAESRTEMAEKLS